MDKRLKYFKAYEQLFEQTGWKILYDEAASSKAKAEEALKTAPTWEAVNKLRGYIQAWDELLTLEATIKNQIADLEADDADL